MYPGRYHPSNQRHILQGEYELELRRLQEKEEKGENPWRISELKVSLNWQDRGN
jgi:hypothetical protein